jgi:PD-(D/E)XK nuclease superfamily
LLDVNIASDYGKIRNLFRLKDEKRNLVLLENLLNKKEVYAELTNRFSFEVEFTEHDFLSLLYYMGMLTIKKARGGGYFLQIPNYVIGGLYYRFFAEVLRKSSNYDFSDLVNAIDTLSFDANITLLCEQVKIVLKVLSNRDSPRFSEKHLKVVFIALLNLSQNYYIKSEYESEKEFIDILLLERPPIEVDYQHAIELKYLHKEEKDRKEEVMKAGIAQLEGYLTNEEVRDLPKLKAFVILFVGEDYEIVQLR